MTTVSKIRLVDDSDFQLPLLRMHLANMGYTNGPLAARCPLLVEFSKRRVDDALTDFS